LSFDYFLNTLSSFFPLSGFLVALITVKSYPLRILSVPVRVLDLLPRIFEFVTRPSSSSPTFPLWAISRRGRQLAAVLYTVSSSLFFSRIPLGTIVHVRPPFLFPLRFCPCFPGILSLLTFLRSPLSSSTCPFYEPSFFHNPVGPISAFSSAHAVVPELGVFGDLLVSCLSGDPVSSFSLL